MSSSDWTHVARFSAELDRVARIKGMPPRDSFEVWGVYSRDHASKYGFRILEGMRPSIEGIRLFARFQRVYPAYPWDPEPAPDDDRVYAMAPGH